MSGRRLRVDWMRDYQQQCWVAIVRGRLYTLVEPVAAEPGAHA